MPFPVIASSDGAIHELMGLIMEMNKNSLEGLDVSNLKFRKVRYF